MVRVIEKKISEKSIVFDCIKQKPQALEQLYIVMGPYMKGICIRYMFHESIAEDIMQEGFIKVFAKIKAFTWNGEGSLRAWISRIMVNICIDTIRAQQKFKSISYENEDIFVSKNEEKSAESLYEIIVQSNTTQNDLLKILNTLPDSTRLVFNMYAIEQLKHKEIAHILGIKEEASRTRLKRARKQLIEKLSQKFAPITKAVKI